MDEDVPSTYTEHSFSLNLFADKKTLNYKKDQNHGKTVWGGKVTKSAPSFGKSAPAA